MYLRNNNNNKLLQEIQSNGNDNPLKGMKGLCHFSCGVPMTDERYPNFEWETDMFEFVLPDS